MTPTDDDYLLFPAKVHGYSLSDREWLEFRLDDIAEVTWNPSIFDSLELDADNKYTIRALIESQCNERAQFDDFVLGKGRGLIFNLHGPPGVGKTLTAEATSEVTRSPLYMIGAGDLGTHAGDLDHSLAKVSTLAYRWKAVVLIDEADVFLEKRENKDIHRNAMVAVFLRQLEYYAGILFLTTNRVSVFDEAIQSRIHVTLHYDKLSETAREHLWDAFLKKADYPEPRTPEQTRVLRELPLNGREIKNIVKVATTLASYENRPLKFEDVQKALKILNPMK
ncbi:P-loop containing nucleoside triphosphate hydrolase protein [Dendrothele bispora CBS 962.96]|uniref:P-loop containing nucleoside triphosphate hydrolase protein n=1 Tax=Dendrothele bispora (strain CBS 962.96) TaxID=1314807 RepID=A0A4S8KIC2_DENBC|nr:P-loop containing nucleoside triphosphate hydrolase protein [Dendrothele bispora CBS 962.96]